MKRLNNKGITLIALVITIIVLLILAGVTIATLTGENGILTRASDAKVETRGATVEEEKELWRTNKIANKYSNGNIETLAQLLERLGPDGSKLLTEDEIEEIKETGQVTIGSRTIEFGTDAVTIGEIYSDDMIGQKMTYTSNGQSEWIIFGKDNNGNILLTTEEPIEESFYYRSGGERWLKYEDELNEACSVYGTTIKDKEITSRSITMDDINYVTGFDVDKLTFDTYTFGTEQDYANKKVDYYFPSLDAEDMNYWKKASKPEEAKTFQNNWYAYWYNTSEEKVTYHDANTPDDEDATSLIKNSDNLKYVWGEEMEWEYLVASRAIQVENNGCYFFPALVSYGGVWLDGYDSMAKSNSTTYDDYDIEYDYGMRPIAVLPSDLEVEEDENGVWDIAY